MASRCMYYFEVSRAYTDHIDTYAAGVYSACGYVGGFMGWQSRLWANCSRVWMQGPRGGVKIVKDRISYPGGVYRYVTNNPELMKKFAWIKLSARHIGPK